MNYDNRSRISARRGRFERQRRALIARVLLEVPYQIERQRAHCYYRDDR